MFNHQTSFAILLCEHGSARGCNLHIISWCVHVQMLPGTLSGSSIHFYSDLLIHSTRSGVRRQSFMCLCLLHQALSIQQPRTLLPICCSLFIHSIPVTICQGFQDQFQSYCSGWQCSIIDIDAGYHYIGSIPKKLTENSQNSSHFQICFIIKGLTTDWRILLLHRFIHCSLAFLLLYRLIQCYQVFCCSITMSSVKGPQRLHVLSSAIKYCEAILLYQVLSSLSTQFFYIKWSFQVNYCVSHRSVSTVKCFQDYIFVL